MVDDIRRLLGTYADAVCRRDAGQWGATWATDGVWELGPGRSVEGRTAMVALWSSIMAGFEGVLHSYGDGWADLDDAGGVGTGRWYVSEVLKPAGKDPYLMTGYYDDRYRREDGEWRFAGRSLTPIYRGPADYTGEYLGFPRP